MLLRSTGDPFSSLTFVLITCLVAFPLFTDVEFNVDIMHIMM